VAGPGDALASDHALRALRQVHERFPDLLKCLSTNGLRLAERADEVWSAGVRSITVTVNAVDPDILTTLCSRIVHGRRVIHGKEAASYLVEQQLSGISLLSKAGAVVKVNTVLVPDVNDRHIDEIVSKAAAAGAHVANIIPLIPNGEFCDYRAPSAEELESARKIAESHLAVYRTCRQCRADACGVPGSGVDFARQVFGEDVVDGNYFSHG
jgi:nitrogen fixation protein NifB